MQFTKAIKVARLSICPCGAPNFVATVQIGDEYVAIGLMIEEVSICRSCGVGTQVNCLYIMPKGGARGGFMPMDLFDWNDPLEEKQHDHDEDSQSRKV